MRRILLAALLCAATAAIAPPVHARGLTTTPNADGAMLIPTVSSASAHIIPIQYYRRHHHWHHRRYHHGRYR